MSEQARVFLCPLKMQECLRGETPCPYQPVVMGVDTAVLVENAEACEYAGRLLHPFYYRGSVGARRRRYL